MKKISLQWRLTCIITLYIAVICGCLTLLVYKNGIYYIDSLQETVDARDSLIDELAGYAKIEADRKSTRLNSSHPSSSRMPSSA